MKKLLIRLSEYIAVVFFSYFFIIIYLYTMFLIYASFSAFSYNPSYWTEFTIIFPSLVILFLLGIYIFARKILHLNLIILTLWLAAPFLITFSVGHSLIISNYWKSYKAESFILHEEQQMLNKNSRYKLGQKDFIRFYVSFIGQTLKF